MEAQKDPQQSIIDQIAEYAEIRFKLTKYKAIDSGTSIFASIITDAIVMLSMVLAFVFASFTLAFYLSQLLESYWEGFGCVTLLYLFIAIVIKVNKRKIEKPLVDAFVKKIFK